MELGCTVLAACEPGEAAADLNAVVGHLALQARAAGLQAPFRLLVTICRCEPDLPPCAPRQLDRDGGPEAGARDIVAAAASASPGPGLVVSHVAEEQEQLLGLTNNGPAALTTLLEKAAEPEHVDPVQPPSKHPEGIASSHDAIR
jgi:hypothetical protein